MNLYSKKCGYYSININSDRIMCVIQKAKSGSSVEQRLAKIGGYKTLCPLQQFK